MIEEHECESGSIKSKNKSLFNFSAGKSNALASSNYRAFPANIHKPAQQCANNRLQATAKAPPLSAALQGASLLRSPEPKRWA